MFEGEVTLHIQKRTGRYAAKYGPVSVIAINGHNWAEMAPDCFDAEYQALVAEDYMTEILSLVNEEN